MTWTLPIRLGGKDRTLEIEHGALLDHMRRKGFDVSEGTALYDETRADARAVTFIWRINRRVGNQNFPLKMYENLPKWEEATGLKPAPGSLDSDRRSQLAAKLRGLGGNDVTSMSAAMQLVLGRNFEAFNQVDPADWIVYMPGLNPGPPGYGFSSNRATVGIQMNKQGLDETGFRDLRDRAIRTIDDLRPSWMIFVVGTDDTFVCGIGIVGQSVVA